ncbi:MAG TPA: bilirubin oxidase, partial [Actinomycetes bacterium]|nr:bilirubin oxidase [Actinomycetes bacterium]
MTPTDQLTQTKITRRSFLTLSATGALVFVTPRGDGSLITRALATSPATPALPASAIPKFVTPLLIPPAMPRKTRINRPGDKPIDVYEIEVRQFVQQVLPAGLPATTVWGYGTHTPTGELFNAPSATIEAKYQTPVRVTWENALTDMDGRALPHLLPVDPTLHWANPPGGNTGRDSRPEFASTPGAYQGPVPLVTHLHGAESVGD